ncbi:myeloid leukemia factor isoform X2 [Anabrus simplex]|uniref:myeloid leukemia factor isoform X2 n=1 Tax=Anabrus simplex TaxID=316456 RepID=UPI0034DD915F
MSLFGSLMGDFEDDPFFGPHMRSMRQMNNMMNSMFANPFGFMGGMDTPAIGSSRGSHDIMPFGFPSMNMNRLFVDLDRMGNDPNCHAFSSSTVMTMSRGPDGQPQVYQASSSMRSAPGGIKETKKTVCDSRSGVKKMAIGHHIGERAHVLEREQNLHSGEREERQEFINLDEEEAEDFNKEFEQKARQAVGPAISYPTHRHGRRNAREPQLALPSSTSTTQADSPTANTSPRHQEKSRKRDHEPGSERISKALKPSHETSM